MATSMGSFEAWLTEKLTSLSPEFDTDVFVSYIISMLDDTDSAAEETAEGIEEFLSQVLDGEGSKAASQEIVDQWNVYNGEALAAAAGAVKKDAGDMLSEIMVTQTLATVKEKSLTAEEKANKQAILAQYSTVSEGDDSDVEIDAPAVSTAHKAKGEPAESLMARNVNAASVTEAQQAQREQLKAESDRKKEKDKQDREAQRQKQQQRKEAEKKRTQKGEKRR
ncbi:coiled-coil domain-containing protein 43-like [Littorina saxatilis]|uniref:Coiled-coil domain-containing protein 43 n=1 Tax=Littorina saxatilis TaxID=31220 RepID=A0AAN9AS61_9CAEN